MYFSWAICAASTPAVILTCTLLYLISRKQGISYILLLQKLHFAEIIKLSERRAGYLFCLFDRTRNKLLFLDQKSSTVKVLWETKNLFFRGDSALLIQDCYCFRLSEFAPSSLLNPSDFIFFLFFLGKSVRMKHDRFQNSPTDFRPQKRRIFYYFAF